MKMNVTRTITTVLLILFFTLPALATEIKGKVVDVEALRAKIAYESDFAPREGDKVQIGFEFGEDFIPVEGEWKIVKVNIDFLWAESKSADSGTPALNYLAIIQSGNPQKRSDLASSREKKEEKSTDDTKKRLEKDKIRTKQIVAPKPSLQKQYSQKELEQEIVRQLIRLRYVQKPSSDRVVISKDAIKSAIKMYEMNSGFQTNGKLSYQLLESLQKAEPY